MIINLYLQTRNKINLVIEKYFQVICNLTIQQV